MTKNYNPLPSIFIDAIGNAIIAGQEYAALGEICIASFEDEILIMTNAAGSQMQWHWTEYAEYDNDLRQIWRKETVL